jgi:hypothetical protein
LLHWKEIISVIQSNEKKVPVIGLLTDFGIHDHYAGTMKGVILSINPEARIIIVLMTSSSKTFLKPDICCGHRTVIFLLELFLFA